MIETIYLDCTGEAPDASRYTVLLRRLRDAETAQKIHEDMHVRMLARHTQRVQAARTALTAELDRLRDETQRLADKYAGGR